MLVSFTGPSGSGKSTLAGMVVAAMKIPVHLARSYTTRSQMPGEINGLHYHFTHLKNFTDMIIKKEFLEYAEVYGHHYGTPVSETAYDHVLLEIDAQGARKVKEKRPDLHRIYILPASREAVERQMRFRRRDSEAEIGQRLAAAATEIAQAREFDAWVVNEDVEQTTKKLVMLLSYFGMGHSVSSFVRTFRDERLIDRVLSTFVTQPA